LTSVANDDVLVIVDDSASETKKISFANLSSGISVGSATELQFTALNSTGATITKGSPVYVSGHTTETQVADADNSSASTMPAFGIAKDDIANGATGTIVIAGEITGINTSSFTVGDELYVGTGGALTATKPTGTALIQKVAKVTKAAASGEILVTGAGRTNDLPNLPDGNIWIGDSSGVPQDKTLTAGTNVTITEDATTVTIAATGAGGASALDDLTDVTITGTPGAGELLINNATSGQFVNATLTAGSNVTITEGDGSITIASSAGGATDLDGLSDVTITGTPAAGEILINNATTGQFVNSTLTAGTNVTITEADGSITIAATGAGGATDLNGLTDVTITGTPGAGEVLINNATSGDFENATLTAAADGFLRITNADAQITLGAGQGTELQYTIQSSAVSAAGEVEGSVVKFGTTSGLTAGSVYVWNGTDWVAVDADDEATTKGLMGVALGTAATSGFLTHGTAYLSHDPGTAGDILYVDTVTAGYLTSTQPSATGDFVRVAGYCLADNKVFFSPSQDWIEIA